MTGTLQDLLALRPADFQSKVLTAEQILQWFDLCDASWVHDGDSNKPHAELTSGKCSNGFFDCLRVLKYVNLSDILANQLALRIREVIGPIQVDWVIGSPMAGITFAHDVARVIGAPISAFVEKDLSDPDKMLWKRLAIPEGKNVLQIEELITTSKTTNAVQAAINESNPNPVNWLPVIGVLVHRPPKLPVSEYGGRQVIPVIEREVWAVSPEDCPLCKAGSVRYRPKTHWRELTGKA